MSKQIVVSLALVVGLVVAGCQPSEPANESADNATLARVSAGAATEAEPRDDMPVATIGDRTITVGELDAYIKDALFEKQSQGGQPTKLYEMRSKALASFMEHAIVETAASAENLTAAEYLEKSVTQESEIPSEEVAAYYEANSDKMGDATLEEIGPRIRSHLRTQLATEFIAKMKAESGALVLLKPARANVAAIGPSQGPADAPITIVEFSDFQCPYCKRVVPTLHEIVEKYPDQVRVVFRHLPLDRIHGRARPAAEASACADQQDRFWEYHDIVFENNTQLSDEDLSQYARDAELDMEAFEKCVKDRVFQAAVQNDTEAAEALGLGGTPAFYINGIPLRGAKPVAEFTRIIEDELALQKLATPNS